LRVSVYLLAKLKALFPEEADYPGVRIGLHYGELFQDPTGDRIGKAAHLVFRLQGATARELVPSRGSRVPLTERDRILATEDFLERIDRKRARDMFRYCGEYLFKGFDSPVKAYLAVGDSA
jgi:class 3 adenylate cyclase